MNTHLDNYLIGFHDGVQKLAFELTPEHYLAIVGALSGGGLGAMLDKGKRWRGGLIGAGLGGAGGFGVGHLLGDKLPSFGGGGDSIFGKMSPREAYDAGPLNVNPYQVMHKRFRDKPTQVKDFPPEFRKWLDIRGEETGWGNPWTDPETWAVFHEHGMSTALPPN